MKAVILAAGLGTRVLPYTQKIPKVLLSLDKKPLLYYQLIWLKKNGIKDVAINTHHLHEVVESYLRTHDFGMKIELFYEPVLMGTAGALSKMKEFFGKERFLVYYGDNITNLDLRALERFHDLRKGAGTICLHAIEPHHIEHSSIVEMDEKDRILRFEEKPQERSLSGSMCAFSNAGIYLFEAEMLGHIPDGKFSDFGRDILPKAAERCALFGFPLLDCYWKELGTVERYEAAAKEFSLRIPPGLT